MCTRKPMTSTNALTQTHTQGQIIYQAGKCIISYKQKAQFCVRDLFTVSIQYVSFYKVLF